MTASRYLSSVLVLSVVLLSLASAKGQDDLVALVADYDAYRLPLPPDQCQLAVLKWSNGTVNGVPQ